MNSISYKKGYKYQLVKELKIQTNIFSVVDIMTEYINLTRGGLLHIKVGYAWDGASGPALDTKNFMRGSLVHDALYQLMRMNRLNKFKHRKTADSELARICKEDGMSSLRAWFVYKGVRLGGDLAADPVSVKKIFTAPK